MDLPHLAGGRRFCRKVWAKIFRVPHSLRFCFCKGCVPLTFNSWRTHEHILHAFRFKIGYWWYDSRMKEKTSITLSSDVLAEVDDLAGSKISRSALIEDILRGYFRERSRRKTHARDLERINAAADRLNSEAADVMEYQAFED
jgi:Arc/MetJ family transcription regulator